MRFPKSLIDERETSHTLLITPKLKVRWEEVLMAVYTKGMENEQYLTIQVTKRFKVFDMVEVTFKDGRAINGEIVYVEKEFLHITGPYMPIEIVDFKEIVDINYWIPPEEWK